MSDRFLNPGDGFTSARVISKGLFDVIYGRIECRAVVPRGSGLWSAFWALGADIDDRPWPNCGEIDIMRISAVSRGECSGHFIAPGHSGLEGISGHLLVPTGLNENFHLYAVEWSPDHIAWSIDGTVYHVVTKDQMGLAWVFDHPFYLLINLAIGGTLGGRISRDTRFPARLMID